MEALYLLAFMCHQTFRAGSRDKFTSSESGALCLSGNQFLKQSYLAANKLRKANRTPVNLVGGDVTRITANHFTSLSGNTCQSQLHLIF